MKVIGLLGEGQELVWAPTERERVLASSKSRIFLSILGISVRSSVIKSFWSKCGF
jgi:hypothetical protein